MDWVLALKNIKYLSEFKICYNTNGCEIVKCRWNHGIYIFIEKTDDYEYFYDYFDVINMLELNGIEIVSNSRAHNYNPKYDIQKMWLLYDDGFYYCSYKGVREKLKNVIDKILSTTKIAQNESI